MILDHIYTQDIDLDTLDEMENYLGCATNVTDEHILYYSGMINRHPIYSKVAARLLALQLKDDVYVYFDCSKHTYFKEFIQFGVEMEMLDKRMGTMFDLDVLNKSINFKNMSRFSYLGLKTLIDRYFIRSPNGTVIELPQTFFMRVAMGLALNTKTNDKRTPTARAIALYNQIASFNYMPSTPTLFNSGTLHPQLSSCFVSTIEDSIDGIFKSLHNNAHISKWAGGIGTDWTNIRSTGSRIVGTKGASQGVVPFMKIFNDLLVAVNQGGKRRGAGVAYLEPWHKDFPDFLNLRKNTGDERQRCHDMNTATWIPDLFMLRVTKGEKWSLFDPKDVPKLHKSYGLKFSKLYVSYEENNSIDRVTVDAQELYKKMLISVFETGHPWFTFKDAFNERNPQAHDGVINSSNLCTEIGLNTSKNEIAVCNLGSINVNNFVTNDGTIAIEALEETVNEAVVALNHVIDINEHVVYEAGSSNHLTRAIGLGMMGLHTMLQRIGIPIDSNEACELSANLSELIQYHAMCASVRIASERKQYPFTYPTFDGSTWSRTKITHETYQDLVNYRQALGVKIDNYRADYDNCIAVTAYDKLRANLARNGIYNSNLTAIAPTATIANICDVSPSIEPIYSNVYIKRNLSGEFQYINPQLVAELERVGLLNDRIITEIQVANGSIQHIEGIPKQIKEVFKTAFECDQSMLIKAASWRQKYIDQSQSLNLYLAEPDGNKLSDMYINAWQSGLKSTYYLRTQAATTTGFLAGGRRITSVTKACNIDDGSCESCQ